MIRVPEFLFAQHDCEDVSSLRIIYLDRYHNKTLKINKFRDVLFDLCVNIRSDSFFPFHTTFSSLLMPDGQTYYIFEIYSKEALFAFFGTY